MDWSTQLSLVEDDAGSHFLGDLAAEQDYDGYLLRLVAALEGTEVDAPTTLPEGVSRELEVAVAFAKEQTEINYYVAYGGDTERGPMLTAYLAAEEAAHDDAAAAAWWAMPVEKRPLDPELTPPEVLAGLVQVQILVRVDEAARLEGVVSVIRTPLGVSHAAELSVGSFSASILVPPGEPWEIVISRDPYMGEGTVVGTVDALETTEGDAVLVEIPASVVDAVQQLGFPNDRLEVAADLSMAITQEEFLREVEAISS